VGKTTLMQLLPEGECLYVNCDSPRAAQSVADPEFFYQQVKQPIVIFDEIHQLPDPSRLLKIGADVFPHLKIVATGSSTLAAARKFKDTLTGRERVVCLRPVLFSKLAAFGVTLEHRLLRGGLPPPLLADHADPGFYAEWLDSHFARDVQELFGVAKRTGYISLLQVLLRQGLVLARSPTARSGLRRAPRARCSGCLRVQMERAESGTPKSPGLPPGVSAWEELRGRSAARPRSNAARRRPGNPGHFASRPAR
jgi:hypothetical protein